jgi:hypothetical protein
MIQLLKNILNNTIESSELLGSIRSLKKSEGINRLSGNRIRSLSHEEIRILEAQGNTAHDWGKILVTSDFKPGFIYNNTFIGNCILGIFSGIETEVDNSVILRSGLYRNTIINSEIGNECLIYNAGVISNYLIKHHSIIYQTNSITASENCTFGNGEQISLGIESGGREVLSYSEMTIQVAESIAMNRHNKEELELYKEFVHSYTDICRSSFGIIEDSSIIRFTGKVIDSYIASGTIIDNATLVDNCTILGSREEPVIISHGACVKNACLQWGSQVTTMSILDQSILTEHSHIERHGKVTHSIIGPNSVIAEGEVTSCLIGPFVAFHHQALLIAALWPEGKGNVGYGANVGSNHTSKAPDQEILCGEGTFFGLGVNIKYPSNFSEAPYTIIATGVDTLPQRVEFPFSLINKSSQFHENITPVYNEIFPGWVLSENLYMIKRNEIKFKERNKARRSNFAFDVFRSIIIDKMILARNRLRDIKQIKDMYIDKDIQGLGKNYLTEKNRQKGIDTYNFYLEYYILSELKKYLSEEMQHGRIKNSSVIYTIETNNNDWEHARRLLTEESLHQRSLIENLKQLITIQRKIAKDTEITKEKDDLRGIKIIDDYAEIHGQAKEDSFVKTIWMDTEIFEKEIEILIEHLSAD